MWRLTGYVRCTHFLSTVQLELWEHFFLKHLNTVFFFNNVLIVRLETKHQKHITNIKSNE